jgi:3-oxoacyl-[acyl-carrier-protein] synthase II
MRRVVISGIGIVASIGADTASFWNNCLAGAASVARIPEEWAAYHSYSSKMWAPLPTVDFSRHHINRIEIMQCDKTALLAMAAADQALSMSGANLILKNEKKNTFSLYGLDPLRCGVYMGTGVGGIASFAANEGNHLFSNIRESFSDSAFIAEKQEQLSRIVRYPPRFHPFAVAMTMPNTAAATLGIKYSLNGPNRTFCNACAAGTTALGEAFRAISRNELDWALAGGVEYLHDDYGGIFRGFDIAGTLISGNPEPQANRPFDANRRGFLMAEGGCAILVLESLEHAKYRHAPQSIAEIRGFAETFDATSIMSPDPSGTHVERMIRLALADANIPACDIDYINAHGTGTQANDDIEAAVIERVFADRPLVNATKSLTGHAIGASGAIEAAVTALSLQTQTTHACLNLREPIRPLNFVRETRQYSIETALTQSFAFGGHNAGLVMSRY